MNRRSRNIFVGVIGLAIIIVAVGLVSRSQQSSDKLAVSAEVALRQTQVALQQTEVAVQATQVALQQAVAQKGQTVSGNSGAVMTNSESTMVAPATLSLPTETPVPPTSTATPTLVPSPTRTSTPLPTPTSTPTPVPPPQFNDNFDGGLLPGWQPVFGQVGTVNGKMTLVDISQSKTGIIALGGPEWDNFALEFDVSNLKDHEPCKNDISTCYAPDGGMNTPWAGLTSGNFNSRIAILVNIDPYQTEKLGKSEGFIVGESRLGWGTLDLGSSTHSGKGEWMTVVGGGLVDTSKMLQPRHFRIEKRGQNYLVFYNGQQISQYSTRLPAGKLGIWFGKLNDWDTSDPNAVPMVDNFEVKPLQ
ncbi:hypothetical protein ANRL4_02345 [Anaerolineae bacterium]|nr:hypothetical protein ANRL4_02345 [Anaerolineae bacterium]